MSELKNFLYSLEQIEKASKRVLKEAVNDDQYSPIPNMGAISICYGKNPKMILDPNDKANDIAFLIDKAEEEGNMIALQALKTGNKGTSSEERATIQRAIERLLPQEGDFKPLKAFDTGFADIVPFYTLSTNYNGYTYFICGVRSDKSIRFSIKVPTKWIAAQHGHGTNWAELSHPLLDRKLGDFSQWQFGTRDSYIITKCTPESAQANNFDWLDTPYPGTDYYFSVSTKRPTTSSSPKRNDTIGYAENRSGVSGRNYTEVIKKDAHKNTVISKGRASNIPSGPTGKERFFRMPDGRLVKYERGQSSGPRDISSNSYRFLIRRDRDGKIKEYPSIDSVLYAIIKDTEANKSAVYDIKGTAKQMKMSEFSGLTDATQAGIDRLRRKLISNGTLKKVNDDFKEGLAEKYGINRANEIMSDPKYQDMIERKVATKLAIYIAKNGIN